MKLFKDMLEDMLKASPSFKAVAIHLLTVANEATRISELVVDLAHDVKDIAEHVRTQGLAIQHLYAVQSAMVTSARQSSLDTSLPGNKKPDDKIKPS